MGEAKFHLAFPVSNLESTREFYKDILGCTIGRESERWIDFNFYGNQITAHLKPEEVSAALKNEVDGDQVPVKHFGPILNWEDWHQLKEKLESTNIDFIIKPRIRFEGEVGEQATMFFLDPSNNAIEIKSFKDLNQVFAK